MKSPPVTASALLRRPGRQRIREVQRRQTLAVHRRIAAAITALEGTTGRPLVWATAQYLSYATPGSVVDIDVTIAVSGRNSTQARAVGHVADREIFTVNAALGARDLAIDEAYVRPIDVPAMVEASRELLGLNDFAAFCRHRPGATTIRDLQRLDWVRDGDRVTAHVTADAFCWNMVRSLVGALLVVGQGRREPAWIAGLLGADHRSSDFAAAPARGLTLIGVDYPPDDELSARILVTRDLRKR